LGFFATLTIAIPHSPSDPDDAILFSGLFLISEIFFATKLRSFSISATFLGLIEGAAEFCCTGLVEFPGVWVSLLFTF
jgi:hypothetical protein